MWPKLTFRVVGSKGKFYREVVEPFLSYTRAKNLRFQRSIQEIGKFKEREREKRRKKERRREREVHGITVQEYKSLGRSKTILLKLVSIALSINSATHTKDDILCENYVRGFVIACFQRFFESDHLII